MDDGSLSERLYATAEWLGDDTPDGRLMAAVAAAARDHEETQVRHDDTFWPYSIQPDKRFFRHWQIEWDGCQFAARGWTWSGCVRRGTRWRAWDDAGRPVGLTWVDWHLERAVWWLRQWFGRLSDKDRSEAER